KKMAIQRQSSGGGSDKIPLDIERSIRVIARESACVSITPILHYGFAHMAPDSLAQPPPAIVKVFGPSSGGMRGGSSMVPRIRPDTRLPQWADGLRAEASRLVRGAVRREFDGMMFAHP